MTNAGVSYLSGVTARAFGLERIAYCAGGHPGGAYREASEGYFDRPLVQAAGDYGPTFDSSVLHAQQANRDNLFLGYHQNTGYPGLESLDFYQIAP